LSSIEDQIRASALRLFRTRQAADAFLTIPCRPLGASPLELLKAGRGAEVLSFLANLEEEAPAPPATLDRIFAGWLGRFGGRR